MHRMPHAGSSPSLPSSPCCEFASTTCSTVVGEITITRIVTAPVGTGGVARVCWAVHAVRVVNPVVRALEGEHHALAVGQPALVCITSQVLQGRAEEQEDQGGWVTPCA